MGEEKERIVKRLLGVVVCVGIGLLVMNASSDAGIMGDDLQFRGDANGDDVVDISDVVFISSLLFAGGPEPSCEDAADANGDGLVNISDIIFLSNNLFAGGPDPSGTACY